MAQMFGLGFCFIKIKGQRGMNSAIHVTKSSRFHKVKELKNNKILQRYDFTLPTKIG